MIDTPETQEAVERWRQGKINIFDEMARLERERDEAERENEQLLASNKTYERDWPILVQERNDLQDQRDLSIRMAKERERQRDEAREKAERYRLEANAMMAQRDEAKRKVSELQAGLDDIEEYGTEEINAAVDLRHQLAAALVECDKLKSEKEANHQCLLMLERDIYKAREDRDKAISVAERLIDYAHECLVKLESWGQGYQRYEDDMDRIREDIAAYNMMKDSLK